MKKTIHLLFLMALSGLIACGKAPPVKLTTDELFQKVKDSIVYIGVRDERGQFVSQGTGMFVSADGYILSNWHVVSENVGGIVQLQNGANYFYDQVLELDPFYDLALIKIEGKTDFQKAKFADSDEVKIGQKVIAIGNPRGMTHTVSEGIVSALRGGTTDKQIQFTAPISPGSSGGALFDEYGRVIGITSSTLLESQNINFAVPIDFAHALIYRRKIALSLSQVKMDKEEIEGLEAYVPHEAALLNALMIETIDRAKVIKDASLSVESLQSSNYDAYLKTMNQLDNETAKMFSYLQREEAFAKALNFLKPRNEKLVAQYKDVLVGEIDVQKILELKDYFTTAYYYQMVQCQATVDNKTMGFLAVEDYGRGKNKCLSDTQTYLHHPGGAGKSMQCTTGDGQTAASSCLKREQILKDVGPYFNNQRTERYYVSGLYPLSKQPVRYIFLQKDALTKAFCEIMTKRENSLVITAGAKCIPPAGQ